MPDVELNSRIQPTTDLSKCYDHEFVVLGLSSQQLIMMKDELQWDKMKTIVTLAKGIVEPEIFISDWISKFYMGNIVVLSGPNLALEIAQKKPAATVVACKRYDVAEHIQSALSNQYFRVYTSTDVRGVECGGIFKNVFAIAAGCLDGLNFGDNAKSALITRGLVELKRLFHYYGAQDDTLMGLSGLGDLIATCSSSKSRNWQLGYEVVTNDEQSSWKTSNRGETEGLRTIQIFYQKMIEASLDLPIMNAIGRLFFEEHASPKKIIHELMERGLKSEFDHQI